MKHWLLLVVALAWLPAVARGPGTPGTYTPPRTRDGQPDLQGIWQVLNTAAWDIQDHNASLGVPAGRGVVVGNEIPYQPWALEKKKQNYANRATLDPDAQVLAVRCAAHHLHAVPVPDRPAGRQDQHPLRIQPHASPHLHERQPASRRADRLVDGRLARPLGRQHAGRRRRPLHRPDVVRSRRQLPQRAAARRRALHADRSEPHALRSDDRGSQGLHPAVEDEHAALPARRAERRAAGIRVLRVPDRGKLDECKIDGAT